MKLTFYVLRVFLISLAQISFFVMALVFIVDVIDQFARFSSRNVDGSLIMIYCILRILENYLQFLPLIILLSTLYCFLKLSNSSEIVIMRAAGIAATRFVFTPLIATFLLGVLIVTALNPLVVSSRWVTQRYENEFLGRNDGVVSSLKGNGIWLRSEIGDETRLIRFDNVNWQSNVLRGVTIYRFFGDQQAGHSEQISAQNGAIRNNEWVLNRAIVSEFGQSIETKYYSNYNLTTDKDFITLFDEYYSPKSIRNYQLHSYVRNLKKDGYDAKEAESYMFSQYAYPLFLVSLALIGSIYALAPARFGGTTRRLFFALGFGFAVYGASQLANAVGIAGYIPIALACFGVPIAAFFIAFAYLLAQEDG